MPCNGCGSFGGFGARGPVGPRFPGRFPGFSGGQSFVRFGPGGSVVVSNNNNNNNNSGAGGFGPWDAPFSPCFDQPFFGPCDPFGGNGCWGPWGPPCFCVPTGTTPPWCAFCPTEPTGPTVVTGATVATGVTTVTGATGATVAAPTAGACGANSVSASSLLPYRRARRQYLSHAELNPPIPDYLPQAQYVDVKKRESLWWADEVAPPAKENATETMPVVASASPAAASDEKALSAKVLAGEEEAGGAAE